MGGVLFEDVSECPTREPARDDTVPDAHRNLVLAVRRVEVGWFVITVEDRITLGSAAAVSAGSALSQIVSATEGQTIHHRTPSRLGFSKEMVILAVLVGRRQTEA